MDGISPEILAAGEGPAQQTAAWRYERCGFATASRFVDVLAKLKSGKPGAARENYLIDTCLERLLNIPTDHFTSWQMKQGLEREPFAKMAYEARTGNIITDVGFIHHPSIEWMGASPDALIDDDGMAQFKCPERKAHWLALRDGMDPDHMPQLQGEMVVCGRAWSDFVSFNPEFPKPLDLYIQRVPRDDAYIAMLESEVVKFLAEVNSALEQMRAKLEEYQQ